MYPTTDPGGTPGPEQGQDQTHGMQDDTRVASGLTGEFRRQSSKITEVLITSVWADS